MNDPFSNVVSAGGEQDRVHVELDDFSLADLPATLCPSATTQFQVSRFSAKTSPILPAKWTSARRMGLMTNTPLDQPADWPDERPLLPWERWTTDWDGQPIIEFDTEAHAEWCEKWAPACPDGNPQRLCHPLGFRERNVGELELRVALGGGDRGVCQVIVDEQEHEVYVRVSVCCYDDDEALSRTREYTDCPVRVWLDSALGDRAVIDVDTDEELPLYTPRYVNNVRQPDHGYRPANRRRR